MICDGGGDDDDYYNDSGMVARVKQNINMSK
jgi:hypothetical protein